MSADGCQTSQVSSQKSVHAVGPPKRLAPHAAEVTISNMNSLSNFVSLHPYFKVHPGKLDAFKASLPAFIDKTKTEQKNLFYDFTFNGDEVFCREAYTDADGLLAHLANVDALFKEVLKIADLTRLEVHGPANELETLTAPLAGLKPVWFVRELS
jgi:quinol monooxygenase YgiN